MVVHEVDAEGGPAGLVAGAQALAGVGVEILVEEQEIAPVGVGLIFGGVAVAGAAVVGGGEEKGAQAAAEFFDRLVEGDGGGAAGDGDFEVVAVEVVITFEGLR